MILLLVDCHTLAARAAELLAMHCIAAEVRVVDPEEMRQQQAEVMALTIPEGAFDVAVELLIDDVPAFEFPKGVQCATARLLHRGRCKRKFDPGNSVVGLRVPTRRDAVAVPLFAH